MRRCRLERWALIVVLSLAVGETAGAQTRGDDIAQAAWMAGCWERVYGPSVTHERWGPERGGMMVGTSQTVRDGETVEYEFLRLFVENGRLVYEAQPSRQALTRFTAASVADTVIVFANPEHDFPQRITYTRAGSDSLVARISGLQNGVERGVDFRFARVACEPRR